MEYRPQNHLLDGDGRPFADHIQSVLGGLATRLVAQFPVLRDDVLLTEVLEEAGRRIADRERRAGRIEGLRPFAWVTLRNVATSKMNLSSVRLVRTTLRSDEGQAALSALTSESPSHLEIERDILFREVLTSLTPEERMVCVWKRAGFSAREIARRRGSSAAAVNALFWRVKGKVRQLLSSDDGDDQDVEAALPSRDNAKPLGERKADETDG